MRICTDNFAKDFLKLANLAEGEEKIKRYFIHLMKDKASDEENIKKMLGMDFQ